MEEKKQSQASLGRERRRAYDVLETLGRGSQATVKLARHKATGALVAIKTIAKPDAHDSSSEVNNAGSSSGLERMARSYATALLNVTTEVKILTEMAGHPAVPRLYEFFESSTKWYIVMEYIQGPVSLIAQSKELALPSSGAADLLPLHGQQSLDTFLTEQGGKLPEQTTIAIVSSILYALAALHARGFVHRDLKPGNIVLRDATNPASLVIIDYGSSFADSKTSVSALAPGLKKSSLNAMQTICGTPFYLPPEIVRGADYDEKVDLWSLGCIAFHLLCGKSPFQDATGYSDLYARILAAKYQLPADSHASYEARWFVSYLLDTVAANRPTAGQALAHPWISPPTPTEEIIDLYDQSGMLVEWDAATGSLKCAPGSKAEKLMKQLPSTICVAAGTGRY